MNKLRPLCIAAACLAVAALSAYSAASIAGNISLTIDGIATPIEILAFKIGASNSIDPGDGGAAIGKVAYDEFAFSAPESAATPLQLEFLNLGRLQPNARLRVLSPDGLKLLSEWSFQNVAVTSLNVESGPLDPKAKPNFFLPPQTSFRLRFRQICYKVFAPDGSIASQTCFNRATNTV